MKVIFRGTRGAYPIQKQGFEHLGGLTNCVEVWHKTSRIIIDAGSGLTNCESLATTDIIVLSHFHLDHLIGLPEFLTRKKEGDVILASALVNSAVELNSRLGKLFGSEFFPVTLETIHTQLRYLALSENTELRGWQIASSPLNHPGGGASYRISPNGVNKSITHLMDHEHGSTLDADLSLFALNTDLLVWDGCYDNNEYKYTKGFGHSTWEAGRDFAMKAQASKLVISGHSTSRSDNDAAAITKRLNIDREIMAYDGLVLEI